MKVLIIILAILVVISLVYSFVLSKDLAELKKSTQPTYEKSVQIDSLKNDGDKLLLEVCKLKNGTICDEETFSGEKSYRKCCKDDIGNKVCVSKEVISDTPRLC